MTLERIFQVMPAFDHRDHPDPALRSKGQHCADLYLGLKGDAGAIVLRAFTGWGVRMLDLGWYQRNPLDRIWPMGVGVGFHHRQGRHGVKASAGCPYLDGAPCHLIVEGMSAAEDLWRALVTEGTDRFWLALENAYRRNMGDS